MIELYIVLDFFHSNLF